LAVGFDDHHSRSPGLKPWCALPASYESWWSYLVVRLTAVAPVEAPPASRRRRRRRGQQYPRQTETARAAVSAPDGTARVKDGCLGRPSDVTVSTAVMAGQLGHFGTWGLTPGQWISGPAGVPALSCHLHVGVVDLDTVDPPDQDQDLVHTGYTRRSQTSNDCQRSTRSNGLVSWHIHRLPTPAVNP
jgi:hypothetical protein